MVIKICIRNNKLYGWIKRKISNNLKNRVISEETRKKQSITRTGKKLGPRNEECKKKMSAASKGKPKSEAHKKALSDAKMGKKLKLRTDEWKQNQRLGVLKSSKSRIKGIYFCKQVNKWKSKINVNGKCIYLGAFINPEDAGRAYQEASKKYYNN